MRRYAIVAGLEITIYNPTLDPSRTAARGLVTAVSEALSRRPGPAS